MGAVVRGMTRVSTLRLVLWKCIFLMVMISGDDAFILRTPALPPPRLFRSGGWNSAKLSPNLQWGIIPSGASRCDSSLGNTPLSQEEDHARRKSFSPALSIPIESRERICSALPEIFVSRRVPAEMESRLGLAISRLVRAAVALLAAVLLVFLPVPHAGECAAGFLSSSAPDLHLISLHERSAVDALPAIERDTRSHASTDTLIDKQTSNAASAPTTLIRTSAAAYSPEIITLFRDVSLGCDAATPSSVTTTSPSVFSFSALLANGRTAKDASDVDFMKGPRQEEVAVVSTRTEEGRWDGVAMEAWELVRREYVDQVKVKYVFEYFYVYVYICLLCVCVFVGLLFCVCACVRVAIVARQLFLDTRRTHPVIMRMLL